MAGVVKAVGGLFGGGGKKDNSAAEAAKQQAEAQIDTEEQLKKRKLAQEALLGSTIGGGDAPDSFRATLLGINQGSK